MSDVKLNGCYSADRDEYKSYMDDIDEEDTLIGAAALGAITIIAIGAIAIAAKAIAKRGGKR